MNDARHLFRATALDRLSSPDQLDQLLPATAPSRWIALSGLALLTCAGLYWSIVSEVPTRVEGRGVLLARGGSVTNAMVLASGTVTSVAVAAGDIVAKDQIIADIGQPTLKQTVENARTQAAELVAEHERLTRQFSAEADLKRDALARQRAALQAVIDGAHQRSAYYLQTLSDLENQVERGYITRQRMQDARQAWQTADQEAKRVTSDLVGIDNVALDVANRQNDELTKSSMRVNEAARRLTELEAQLHTATRVLAPTAGTVIEVQAETGAYVATGTSLVSIQTGSAGLEFFLYIPLAHGKEVKPGMIVQVEPTTVKKEEYGTMLGRVVSVSEFPVTTQGMMAVLQNSDLVRQFSKPAPPYVARVELLTRDSEGDAAWSSGTGPPITITSGTLANAEVTVRRQHPITLIMPSLNRAMGWGQ